LAEPHRRQTLDLLLLTERPMGGLVAVMTVSQPAMAESSTTVMSISQVV
jgi:hypothetical protein